MIANVPLPVAVVHLTVRTARMPLPHRIIITLTACNLFNCIFLTYTYGHKIKFVLMPSVKTC